MNETDEITEFCEVCGDPIECLMMMPSFESGSMKMVKKKVRCTCSCVQKMQEEEERAREWERKQERISRLQKLSLIDERLKNVNFDDWMKSQNDGVNGMSNEALKLSNLVMKYLNGFDEMKKNGMGILFWGDVGVGKTYTAAVICNELLKREVSVVMTSFIRLIDEAMKFDDKNDYISKLDDADLLIVDDLGAERGTDFALEKVYEIVDQRYRTKKPLILTTNMTLKEMNETTDMRYRRIYDRIFEMCYQFHITGVSWRKAKAAENYDQMQKMMEG